ncbi:MAG: transporter substrate-binding protein [Oligoflexia bacterium]|nr:transporter substrate-binding protein [Oligoflexia bacterium]
MNNNVKINLLALFIILGGILLFIGGIYNLPPLNLNPIFPPIWQSAKFTITACFAVSGIMLLFIANGQHYPRITRFALMQMLTIIALMIVSLLLSIIIKHRTTIDAIFLSDHDLAAITAVTALTKITNYSLILTVINVIFFIIIGMITITIITYAIKSIIHGIESEITYYPLASQRAIPTITRWLITIVISGIGTISFLYLYLFITQKPISSIFPWGLRSSVIKVGVLHSLTGTMAISEESVKNATLLAIDEINRSGGIGGKRVEAVVADGQSKPEVFKREAERLITTEGIRFLFGCWTSADRKAVIPVLEKYDALLFYPVQHEGLELSNKVIYMGAVPNQQLIPTLKWSYDKFGKRFFLVGSDYVYPRVSNEIAKVLLANIGGVVLGEEYVALEDKDFKKVVKKIKDSNPDVIISTINGEGNIAFLEELHNQRVNEEGNVHSNRSSIPILSLSITENEIRSTMEHFVKYKPKEAAHFLTEHLSNMYASWSYFESISNPLNKDFVANFHKSFSSKYRSKFTNNSTNFMAISDPMATAYYGVMLWGMAMREHGNLYRAAAASNTNRDIYTYTLLQHLYNLSFPAPDGIITIVNNNYARRTVRIGKINKDLHFDIVWSAKNPIEARPYPYYKKRKEWDAFLDTLYQRWNKNWRALPSRISSLDKP